MANNEQNEFNKLRAELKAEIIKEIGNSERKLIEHVAARWVVLKATVEEFDDAQRERIEARAKELAGSPSVKKYVLDLFNPSEEED